MIPVKIQRADTESTKPTLENAHTKPNILACPEIDTLAKTACRYDST